MILVELTSITGVPPYTIKMCDLSMTYCYVVATGVPSLPLELDTPPQLSGADQIMVVIIDSTGCEFFRLISCLTPTPTPTMTPTPTTTMIVDCNCLTFNNTSVINQHNISYINCDGVEVIDSVIFPNTSLYVCGKEPSVDSIEVDYFVGLPCVNNTCPDPTSTPTPTPTVTPTVTPTNTPTPTSTPECECIDWDNLLWDSADDGKTYTQYIDCNGDAVVFTGDSTTAINKYYLCILGGASGVGDTTVTIGGLTYSSGFSGYPFQPGGAAQGINFSDVSGIYSCSGGTCGPVSSPTSTPTTTPTVTPTNTPTTTPTVTPTNTLTVTPTNTPTTTQTVTPTNTPTTTPTPTPTCVCLTIRLTNTTVLIGTVTYIDCFGIERDDTVPPNDNLTVCALEIVTSSGNVNEFIISCCDNPPTQTPTPTPTPTPEVAPAPTPTQTSDGLFERNGSRSINSDNGGSTSTACTYPLLQTVYIKSTSSNNLTPINGDIVYTDSNFQNPFVGQGSNWALSFSQAGSFKVGCTISFIGVVGGPISICNV